MGFEITTVTPNPTSSGRLRHAAIESPRTGAIGHGYLIEISVVAEGTREPVRAVHINQDGSLVVRALTDGTSCSALIATPGLPPTFNLRLFAAVGDEFEYLGEVCGAHDPLPSVPSGVNPILVTSLGRTGTSWLMHLLSHHPEIATDGRWGYELSAIGYWARQFRTMAQAPNGFEHPGTYTATDPAASWWNGATPFDLPAAVRWRSGEHVERIADFCRASIRDCYRAIAAGTSSRPPRYFAEKGRPDHTSWLAHELFPHARELILVRDFRDMVGSILAFNERRGFPAFDRERAASDEQFPYVLRAAVGALRQATIARPASLVVRYEDLIWSPHETMERILTYLDLPADPASVAELLAAPSAPTPHMIYHQTSAAPAESIGRWRTQLAPAVVAACEDSFADALSAFGYR